MVCMVIGGGPARPKLMRDHPDVLFPGYLTGESLAACCASCDIMLFPSETETFGNVLIAVGTLVLSASGTLAGRLGKDRAFAVTLLVGIVVLFAGFLVSPSSKRPAPRHADTPEPEPVTRASAAAASR
jgi:drug/metabolite transporter (DMT)-like permease